MAFGFFGLRVALVVGAVAAVASAPFDLSVIRHRTGEFDTAETEIIASAENVVKDADSAYCGKEQ